MARKPKLKVIESAFQCAPEEREYFRSLHKILDDIYLVATNKYELTWKELAEAAELTYITVKKLGERETRYPRFHTVFKLAQAVGWQISVASGKKVTKKPKLKAAS